MQKIKELWNAHSDKLKLCVESVVNEAYLNLLSNETKEVSQCILIFQFSRMCAFVLKNNHKIG